MGVTSLSFFHGGFGDWAFCFAQQLKIRHLLLWLLPFLCCYCQFYFLFCWLGCELNIFLFSYFNLVDFCPLFYSTEPEF